MKTVFTLFDYDGKAVLIKDFFKHNLCNELKQEIHFESEMIKMYGKEVRVPRLTAYQGKYDYTYSGVLHQARAFTPTVLNIKQLIEAETGFEFNSVLLNLYNNGNDYMGYHRDNEPEMDTTLIASMTFGASRKFKFKHLESKKTIDLLLENGDLLLMCQCQQKWLHALPKSLKTTHERVNLTFRKIDKVI